MDDVLVIGTGFGGLTAAALAARTGASVRVIEAHRRPGGCAGDFALEGYWFPAGATVVTGLEPGGILHRVLGLMHLESPGTPLDPSVELHVSGRKVAYRAELEDWLRELRDAFGDAARPYERFWRWTHEIGGVAYDLGRRLPALPLERPTDLRRTVTALTPSTPRLLRLLYRTVGEEKRRLGATGSREIDRVIDALLLDATGETARQCSAIQGALALDIYRRGCQWVEGGTARLAMMLVRAIRAHGGAVHFRRKATRLRRTPGGFVVETDRGDKFEARAVVPNLAPPAVQALMTGRASAPAREPNREWGAFLLHLGIDAGGLGALHPFQQVVAERGPLHEGGNAFISVYPARAGDAGRWSLSVSTHTDLSRRREEQPVRRHLLEERLIDAVAQVIPDVRDRVLLRRSATPATFERYTLRPGGGAGGLRQGVLAANLHAPGHRPAQGVFLAGDHVFPGQGTLGVALSGINAYRDAMEFLGRRPIL